MAYQNDREYLNRRMDEELERGDRAANSSVAAIHYELAYRYALRCFEEPSGPPTLRLVLGGQLETSGTQRQRHAGISRQDPAELEAVQAQA